MEWSRQYNSFNGLKGMAYWERYRQIVAWLEGASYLPPPIEVNLDPYAECNLNCYFCVTQRYLKHHREEVGPMRSLPGDYMLRLVDYLVGWGVRGLCISGGGEPSLHPGVPSVIHKAADRMDAALVSNVVSVSDELAEAIMRCRWLAMSIDATDAQTYHQVKGKNAFQKVIANVAKLANLRAKTGAKVDLCYKYLILPQNYTGIAKACRLAKGLGVQDFHVRPVDFERGDIVGHGKLSFNRAAILDQFAQCHEMETADFHVYTVTHKFDDAFHNKQAFSQCLMPPILLPILTDGNAYLCVDKKMQARYRLGTCYPDPSAIATWWGSDEHRRLIQSIRPAVDCKDNRCTGQCYNEQIERTVLHDDMCLSFP